MTILVSACLWGCACRYDGRSKGSPCLMQRLAREHETALPVCPEQLGGLPTPRSACRIVGGDGAGVLAGTARVVDKNSTDRTDAFIRGARRALDLALKNNARRCYLKAKSPSCGSGKIAVQIPASDWPPGYRPVLGVTAALFLESGFEVVEIP